MKKTLTYLSVFVLLFSLSISSFAASGVYDLDALGLQVSIPQDYSVITRDTPASDPIFDRVGKSRAAIISQFEERNIYLNALSNTYDEEIVITMAENPIVNLSLLSSSVIDVLAATLSEQFSSNYNINVTKHEIYQHTQAKFIKMFFTDEDNAVFGLQYFTIYDGKGMSFTIRSREGSLSSRQEAAILEIVDSIIYDNAPPVLEEGEDTDAFVHTDMEGGVTYTVPVNWRQASLSKDREYIDVKFVSTKEDGCSIMYSSTDMWAEMSAAERIGYTRADINNDSFTTADVALMLNVTPDKISKVTYNGITYFKSEAYQTIESSGIEISMPMTQLVYINNGWHYLFHFSGTSDHMLYGDFEKLLNSATYTNVPLVPEVGLGNGGLSIDDSTATPPKSVTFLLPAGLAIIAIAVLVLCINKSTKPAPEHFPQSGQIKPGKSASAQEVAAKPAPARTAQPMPTAVASQPVRTTTPAKAPAQVRFCRKCGKKLLPGSNFCHGCGTKISSPQQR